MLKRKKQHKPQAWLQRALTYVETVDYIDRYADTDWMHRLAIILQWHYDTFNNNARS